jgi:hypothetical protein
MAATEMLAISRIMIALMEQKYSRDIACIMTVIIGYGDGGHLSLLAARLLQPKVTSKIVRELAGINMAATNGDTRPCTARLMPMIL